VHLLRQQLPRRSGQERKKKTKMLVLMIRIPILMSRTHTHLQPNEKVLQLAPPPKGVPKLQLPRESVPERKRKPNMIVSMRVILTRRTW